MRISANVCRHKGLAFCSATVRNFNCGPCAPKRSMVGTATGGVALKRLNKGLLYLAVLLGLSGVGEAGARAQNEAGRILGNVADPSGAAIAGARVRVINLARQSREETVTDNDGFYQVLGLPIGAYRVTVEKDGFHQQVFDNQTVQINQSLRVDAKLSIGQKSEVVEVREQTATHETVNQTIGATVGE